MNDCMTYLNGSKIVYELRMFADEHFFQLSSCEYNLRGHSHSMKLSKQRATLDVRKCFFSHRAVKEWNLLGCYLPCYSLCVASPARKPTWEA